ncbi:hypothetical protein LX81_02729 [Palleronia aestuarii]|uniref:Uncharacterized protein n=1 Tax=Palleronia aestuarii TaxID=568105 RepID=A0A2W7N473_9RHOB|nr:hypothetical protein LX81_02729 [Palleronia aestuarii]
MLSAVFLCMSPSASGVRGVPYALPSVRKTRGALRAGTIAAQFTQGSISRPIRDLLAAAGEFIHEFLSIGGRADTPGLSPGFAVSAKGRGPTRPGARFEV